MNVLAVIPARGGSKGLPSKNIRPLAGKPLVAYTIESAKRCGLITRVLVSTDSESIADTAIRYGADAPFLRPGHLAGDKSDLGKAIDHTLTMLANDGYIPDIYVVLYPTSPFRSDGLMRFLVQRLLDGYSHVRTAKRMDLSPRSLFLTTGQGALKPLAGEPGPDNVSPLHRPYGVFSGINSKGVRGSYLHTIHDPMMLVDIDTHEDFHLAESIIQAGSFDFASDETGEGQAATPSLFKRESEVTASHAERIELDICELALREPSAGSDTTGTTRLSDRDMNHQAVEIAQQQQCQVLAVGLDKSDMLQPFGQILGTLERIAACDPDNAVLKHRLGQALEAVRQGTRPHGVAGCLVDLLTRPADVMGLCLDNLLAVAGLAAHAGKIAGNGLAQLKAVRWERVRKGEFFLRCFFRLFGSGLAMDQEAARMVSGLESGLADKLPGDRGLRSLFGVASGFSGLGDRAAAILPSLLENAMVKPDEFFPMMHSLVFAKRQDTARRFFTPRVLRSLDGLGYDEMQQGSLASLLYRIGLERPAGKILSGIGERKLNAPDASLVRHAYALVRVGRGGLARKLIDSFEQRCGTDDLVATSTLARARLVCGQTAKARKLLQSVEIDRLDNDIRLRTFFNLFEQAQAFEQLQTLYSKNFRDDGPLTQEEYLYHFTQAHYSHTLGHVLERALSSLPQFREGYLFNYLLHLNALWAGDRRNAVLAAQRLQAMPGVHACNVHLMHGNVLLIENRLEEAVPVLAKRRDRYVYEAMNLESCLDIWDSFFGLAQLHRHLGNGHLALMEAESCIRLENIPNNPCKALKLLLLQEAGALALSSGEARLFTRMGDAQTAQRSLVTPWLYLQAAFIHKDLGEHEQSARIVRNRLARCAILAPQGRRALAQAPVERSDFRFASISQTIQDAFHPQLKDTYWNHLLQTDIDRH